MALRVSAAMALCLLFSLMAFAHCVPDGEQGPLRLPSRDGSIVSDEVALDGELPMEEEDEKLEVVNPVAEPDPDRSLPEEELTAQKLSSEDEQSDEKTKEQIEDEDEEKKSKKKNYDDGDKDEKKDKKIKKNHQSNDEEGEEKTKKQIHRHHRVEKEKTKNRPYHKSGNDSDDEDEQEKKAKRWRKKAISRRSMFGHGRRSQREEAQTEEVKN